LESAASEDEFLLRGFLVAAGILEHDGFVGRAIDLILILDAEGVESVFWLFA
jgi:hypothetical protein